LSYRPRATVPALPACSTSPDRRRRVR